MKTTLRVKVVDFPDETDLRVFEKETEIDGMVSPLRKIQLTDHPKDFVLVASAREFLLNVSESPELYMEWGVKVARIQAQELCDRLFRSGWSQICHH